ncbi:MAG: hypothetical protein IJW67_13295, partial [Blautia sp.]|nr:hypothetical protein [Blautia sp.]
MTERSSCKPISWTEKENGWNRTKSDYDYGLYFEEWWRNDVTAMVRKDFNHPSVIFYSIGNEIPE